MGIQQGPKILQHILLTAEIETKVATPTYRMPLDPLLRPFPIFFFLKKTTTTYNNVLLSETKHSIRFFRVWHSASPEFSACATPPGPINLLELT